MNVSSLINSVSMSVWIGVNDHGLTQKIIIHQLFD